jgi:hypothetical protein
VRSGGWSNDLWHARAGVEALSGAAATGSGSLVVVCGDGKWTATCSAIVASAVVRVPANLARRSGCCQGWPTGGAVVRREVLSPLDQVYGPSQRWWRSTKLCGYCGSRRVDDPLDGSVWVVWAAMAVDVVALSRVPGRTLCWGFLGQKLWRWRRPWVPLPLLRVSAPQHCLSWAKARSISDRRRWCPQRHSLPEGVATEVRLGHVVAFGGCFRLLGPGLRVELGACIMKSKLLRQGMWLGNDDVGRTPFFVGWSASKMRHLAEARQWIKVLEVSLVKIRSCLEWGASWLGNNGVPQSSFSCAGVCNRRRVSFGLVMPVLGVGARHLC